MYRESVIQALLDTVTSVLFQLDARRASNQFKNCI